MVAEKYGISIYWEVQIIRDQLVDVETTVPGVDKKTGRLSIFSALSNRISERQTHQKPI
jgi:hypothetical protein